MRIASVLLIATIAVFSGATHPALADEDKSLPKGGEAFPWNAALLAGQPKVIYGEDDRLDVFEETNPDRMAWAASTCALVDPTQLTENGDGTYELGVREFRVSGLPACDGEPYADQPVAAFCTGFVVGFDLIATAGHCVDDFTLASTRFAFGFQMLDAQTPRTALDSSQVYQAVEIVAWELNDSGADFAVVRVDRPITAAGARPLPLRKAGTIPVGARVGVIGHPAGLPAKIAFGENSVVRDSVNEGYFVTNLDTYGGNSGSPVFSAETGLVEGILVRGEADYVFGSNCFRSNVLADAAGRGEDVTKSTAFAEYVNSSAAQLTADRLAYGCDGAAEISLFDGDLAGEGTASVTALTEQGDVEEFLLAETQTPGIFVGMLPILAGEIAEQNGRLDVAEDLAIVFLYNDENNGSGQRIVRSVTAIIDCTAPVISNVAVAAVYGRRAEITFETSEGVTSEVQTGAVCGSPAIQTLGGLDTVHSVLVSGLTMLTPYHFTVTVSDLAGNSVTADNGGACFQFTTTEQRDYFSEFFVDTTDLVGRSMTFTPDASISGYSACIRSAIRFPTPAGSGTRLFFGDDESQVRSLGTRRFPYYGNSYDRIYIGSNGYITLGEGDSQFSPSFGAHFSLPRIAPYFSDLYPGGGGLVEVFQDNQHLAVTYQDVPDYYGDIQSVQVELFFNGTIRMTWLRLTRPYGMIGLSAGGGMPADFEESDLSTAMACETSGEGEGEGEEVLEAIAAALLNHFAVADASGNNDGRLSYAEALVALDILSEASFNQLDTNNDGFLSPAELDGAIVDVDPFGCYNDSPGGCFGFAKDSLASGVKGLYGNLLLLLSVTATLALWTRVFGQA
ncbi:MAG: trypsin-like peptidase domain-containing protein [Candidatus Hydrogenedentes bacterium]|nr:trypsin-like peptidase domain-containing protein [Candidatus Hydrogenedentota bacterium]